MQAGAYQNGTWVVGVAKGGTEEGVESLAEQRDHRAVGSDRGPGRDQRRRADRRRAATSTCVVNYKETLFDFARYRRPEPTA